MTWWRHAVFPASQLASAGLTLVLWLIIGQLTDTEAKDVAIGSYALGVPASLLVTLGIPFVLPNTFRSAGRDSRHNSGPWSIPLRIALAFSVSIGTAGVFQSALPANTHSEELTAATLAMAGATAAGIATAQVGRAAGRLALVIVGQLAVPATAVAWLVAIHTSDDHAQRIRIACVLMFSCQAILAFLLRRYLGKCPTDSAGLRRLIMAAALLIPHLLMFGVIIQGARIIAVIGGKPPIVVDTAHTLMLAFSVGLTFLASINSYVAPHLQATPDDAYPNTLDRSLRIYSFAAIGAVVAVWLTLWIFNRASLLTGVTAANYAYVAIALISVGTYYSISAQWVRRLRTAPLTIASTVGATTLVAPTIFGAQFSLDGIVANFAAACITLPAVITIISRVSRDHIRIRFSIWIPLALTILWALTAALFSRN